MQINLTGFLNGRNARQFMDELWALLLSAQESDTGIPDELIAQKKEEILKREEDNKLLDSVKQNRDSDEERPLRRSRSRDNRSRDRAHRPINNRSVSPAPAKSMNDVHTVSSIRPKGMIIVYRKLPND